jgi:hypothetical protein
MIFNFRIALFRKNGILPIQVPLQASQKHVQDIRVSEEPIQISNLHFDTLKYQVTLQEHD